ncbi:sentrin-specific protease 7 isoform X2 [Elgaria multicarinata webbii]|uniref:sentrin-specific protease 7 isoform X2 n=1 Tax=Elgaria multicarinata webbii TaxID=159646 RepID=UPI002FCCFEC5
MEGCGTKPSSGLQNYRIPKKVSNTQSEDAHFQSPLSRLGDTHQREHPLQGRTSIQRNKYRREDTRKRKRHWGKCYIDDEGQPKVTLTNVLKTEIGRKYIKTQLITDANLSHGVKLQSDQQTSSSVDTVEIWQILSPLHQSLFISKRQPKVTLTNILRTKAGRKYMQRHLLTDANLSDANKLQSDEQPSSSFASLESCQKISSQQCRILSKRYQRRPNDQKPSRDAQNNNALLTLRRCDVVLEDCSIKNKEGDRPEKERKDPKNTSPGLREASFQNSESRKTRRDVFPNQRNAYSPQKSPLASEEQRIEPIQSPGWRGSNENRQSHQHNPQQENIPQPLESDCSETFIPTKQDTAVSCPGENSSNSSPRRKQHSATNKAEQISPLTSSGRKQKMHIILRLKEPLNRSERNKETDDSTEPIVLSSDEEEGSTETKDPERDFQTGKGHKLKEKKKKEQESALPLSKELLHGVTESKTEQLSTESLTLHSSADCSAFSEEMDLALDIKSEMLYIGKYKGTATGCVRFTAKYIKIPFEVTLNKKMELSVDSMHLRRYGLWTNNESSTSGSNATIFLWLSSNYAKQIEKQLGTSILNKQAKSITFIFIKLSQPLTEEEQNMLNKIILEVSKTNMSPDLTDSLPWEQAIKEVSCEESTFMDDCYESFQKLLQKDSASLLTEPPPQESKSSLTKPNYTLLRRQSSGQYSFSICSTQKNEWKELRETKGPIRNLIVYPPPPAKGGLGVTKEDLVCLEYGEFLNDVIIDFYLKYLLLEKAPKELADRSHIFSSFFYKCLTRTEKNSEENPNLSIAERRHGRVKRWTRQTNIFNKDYIFVPVNEESHWYIAVICFPWLEEVVYEDSQDQSCPQSGFQQFPCRPEIKSKTARTETVLVFNDAQNDKEDLEINSSLQSKDNVQPGTVSPGLDSKTPKSFSSTFKSKKVCKRPCILILDSLKATSVQNTVQVLREYLEAEWEAKCKTCREFNKTTMVDFCPRVPKQDNNSDCGVYLLQYVETFFQNPVVNFELPMHLERWFPRHVVRSKREEIRDLILQLHLQQQSGSKS